MVLKGVVDAETQSFKYISGTPVASQLPMNGFLFLFLLLEFDA